MLKFDEEAIAWTCNDLFKILDIKTSERPKKLKNQMIYYLEIIKTKYIYIYIYIWLNNKEI